MKLHELIDALPSCELRGDAGVDIRSIEFDSRRVGGGELFVCLEGLARNGHDFAAAAVANGAAALLVTHHIREAAGAPQVVVPDTREAMARVAAAFFSYPAREMEVVGVTGTNGKTTVTHLLEAVGRQGGYSVNVMGTLGTKVGDTYASTGFTTPEAPELQMILRDAADRETSWVAMEVSSHALAQKRTFATDFSAVVFTNLTQDHLDYHGDMDAYFQAKELLFNAGSRGSSRDAVAVINLDDPAGKRLAGGAGDRVATYGFSKGVDYRARRIHATPGGTHYELVTPRGTAEVSLPMLGRFNVHNALAAQSVGMEFGMSLGDTVEGAQSVRPIPGRMEMVPGTQPFLVVIDFAHTPNALERALGAARGFTSGELCVVFGCGGDRDVDKRPEMGTVASRLADRVVVTSDNPRGEDPGRIIEDILSGIPDSNPVLREEDRANAIRVALNHGKPGDTILIAGKGHERVQILGDTSIPFDDRQVAASVLKEIGFDVDDQH